MSEWIAVCGEEGDNPIEVETEEDGTLLLEELVAHFPGTTTLKYRSRETNSYRSVKCSGGVLKPPGGSWDLSPLYICVNPTKAESASKKRSAEPGCDPIPEAKRFVPDYDPTKCVDLIVLGLKPTTTSADIKEYFETFGEVVMIQTKASRDKNVTFAFIRFKDKAAEKKVLKDKHKIDDRECTVRIPDSQQGDRTLRKIYVSYHDQKLKQSDFIEHFEKFGDVVEVFIPNPWRHFCFVTFHDAQVAQSLIGKEHELNGSSLLIKSAGNLKDKNQENNGGAFGQQNQMGGQGNWGQGNWGQGQQAGNMGNMNPNMNPMMGNMGQGMGMNPMAGNMGGNMGGVPNMGGMGQNMGMGNMGGNMGGVPNMSMSGPPPNMGMNKQGGWAGSQNYGYGQGNNGGPVPAPLPTAYGQSNTGTGYSGQNPAGNKSRMF